MGVVLRSRHKVLILLREDKLRRNRVHDRIARLGDGGRARCGLRGGGGHGVRSGGYYGTSGEYGELCCDTAEKRFSIKWHESIPFPSQSLAAIITYTSAKPDGIFDIGTVRVIHPSR